MVYQGTACLIINRWFYENNSAQSYNRKNKPYLAGECDWSICHRTDIWDKLVIGSKNIIGFFFSVKTGVGGMFCWLPITYTNTNFFGSAMLSWNANIFKCFVLRFYYSYQLANISIYLYNSQGHRTTEKRPDRYKPDGWCLTIRT